MNSGLSYLSNHNITYLDDEKVIELPLADRIEAGEEATIVLLTDGIFIAASDILAINSAGSPADTGIGVTDKVGGVGLGVAAWLVTPPLATPPLATPPTDPEPPAGCTPRGGGEGGMDTTSAS